jgi:hypothetical protein
MRYLYPQTDDVKEDVCNNCGQNYAECCCAAERDFERQSYRNADREEWRHEAVEQQRVK